MDAKKKPLETFLINTDIYGCITRTGAQHLTLVSTNNLNFEKNEPMVDIQRG